MHENTAAKGAEKVSSSINMQRSFRESREIVSIMNREAEVNKLFRRDRKVGWIAIGIN